MKKNELVLGSLSLDAGGSLLTFAVESHDYNGDPVSAHLTRPQVCELRNFLSEYLARDSKPLVERVVEAQAAK